MKYDLTGQAFSMRWIIIVLVGTVFISTSVTAQQPTRADATLAKLQQMLRQTSTERDGLKAQLGEVQKKLDDEKLKSAAAQNQLKSTKKNLGDTDAILEKYKTTDTGLRERIEQQRGKMQEVIDKYKELVLTLRQLEAERNQLRVDLTSKNTAFDICAQKNAQLYQTGLELADQYEKKGVWQSLIASEPITQLKRVEIENLAQDYINRVEQSRVQTAESP